MTEGASPGEPPRPEIDPRLLRELEADLGSAPAAPASAEAPAKDAAPASAEPAAPPAAPSSAEAPVTATVPEDAGAPGTPLAARVEALLFAASEPLPLRRLKDILDVADGRAVREAIDALAREYAESGRAFGVEEVAGGFQLRTRAEFAPIVARLGRRTEADRLSAAALETLAIVAYRQPVLRADVERIRGVASGEVLRSLIERGLVRVAGRAELPGSPLLYGTTSRFLVVFGLRDLRDLPREGATLAGVAAPARAESQATAGAPASPAQQLRAEGESR